MWRRCCERRYGCEFTGRRSDRSLDYTELLVGIEDALGVVMAPLELKKREEMDTPNKIIDQVFAECR